MTIGTRGTGHGTPEDPDTLSGEPTAADAHRPDVDGVRDAEPGTADTVLEAFGPEDDEGADAEDDDLQRE